MRTDVGAGAVSLDEVGHVLLVTSGGGHLTQLLQLEAWWGSRERTWVTFDSVETRSRLVGERVFHAFHPTTRNIPNLLRNAALAAKVVPTVRPDLVISSGAAVAVPFFAVARALGLPTVYIEVFDRVDSATMSGRICYPMTSMFLVQRAQQRRLYPKARVVGALL